MVSILPTLLERPLEKPAFAEISGTMIGIESAIHRAQPYLLAGWQLTPEQAMALTGQDQSPAGGINFHGWPSRIEEDELGDTAGWFD